MKNFYCVYKHASPSGKSYIGQTKNYSERCRKHRTRGACVAFSSAIKKYGWDNFSHEILESNLTLDEANFWEEFYINEHKTLYPNGYNLVTGGGNSRPSDEVRKKLSLAQRNRPKEVNDKISKARIGKKLSEEHRVSIAIAGMLRGPISEETRAKLSIASKSHSKESRRKAAEKRVGIPLSEEHKQKIKNAKKVISEETRKKLSEARIGIKLSKESIEKRTASRLKNGKYTKYKSTQEQSSISI